MLQFWIAILVDSLIWMPSVFGLSRGDLAWMPETLTASDLEMVKCICCALWTVRPFTLTPVLESMVSACNTSKWYHIYNSNLRSMIPTCLPYESSCEGLDFRGSYRWSPFAWLKKNKHRTKLSKSVYIKGECSLRNKSASITGNSNGWHIIYYVHTFVLLILQEEAHHLLPEPSIIPPPWILAPESFEKTSHVLGLFGSQSLGSSGATIVPLTCSIPIILSFHFRMLISAFLFL